MKPFFLYVLVDKRGLVWRYTNDTPVTYGQLREAQFDASTLDPARTWKPVKMVCTEAKSKLV